ncbi:sulfite exporter TauE/SafE family protein [Arenicella chitinivorans]|nr:sulfite exporter TauE/SafE family protein [Arenicella chitinivorans]
MTFWSALILGLVGSAHCAGMCGGIQVALQSQPSFVLLSRVQLFHHLLLLNAGRVVMYLTLGVVLSLLGLSVLSQVNTPTMIRAVRLFTGSVVLLIGVHFILRQSRPFRFLEQFGTGMWRIASRGIKPHNEIVSTPLRTLLNGMIWGLIPCGLVYAVLLTTVFTNNLVDAGMITLGFGLGTMPSLVLSGMLFKRLQEIVKHRGVQMAAGVFFVCGGLLIISAPYWVSSEFLRAYPQLINLVFCVT